MITGFWTEEHNSYGRASLMFGWLISTLVQLKLTLQIIHFELFLPNYHQQILQLSKSIDLRDPQQAISCLQTWRGLEAVIQSSEAI